MSDSSPAILIVEDDQSLGSALQSFLAKEGLRPVLARSAEEARQCLANGGVRLMIVDCLLPGESGVDLVVSIRERHPPASLDIILMSGVFIETSFMKESIRQTQALQFLKKPFSLDELKPSLTKLSEVAEAQSPRRQLYRAFSHLEASEREKRKILESLGEIHGFDLPFIYSFLVQSRISGYLNIIDADEKLYGVTFCEGVIVGVDLADSETVLGKLLIESGYILPEDLDEILSSKSSRRIGERLIGSQLLSPHGFEIVLANQMSIRMSRTIVDRAVQVNFVASNIPLTTPSVDDEQLERFIHDWVASKLTLNWLKAHFTTYGNFVIQKGPLYRLQHPAFSSALVASLEGFNEVLFDGSTISEILERNKFSEESFFKAIHYLMCVGVLVLRERPRILSTEDQRKHLRNIRAQMSGKNKVEVFDLMVQMTTASEKNPEQVLQQFLEILGPAPAPTLKDEHVLFGEITNAAREAFNIAQSGDHERLRDEMMRDEVEKKLKASHLFDDARSMLEKAQFVPALQALEKVNQLDPKFGRLRLHLVWARLGGVESSPNKAAVFKAVDEDLMRVDPEDKFDALYSFIMGLYAKAQGDYGGAKRNFEKAVGMDSTFIAARRELAVIATLNRPKQDVFNQDLKTLVGSLFKKK